MIFMFKTRDKLVLIMFGLFVLIGMAYLWLSPANLKTTPDIKLVTLPGKSLSLASPRGKPVLVTFWATSCPDCIQEVPHLVNLYNEFSKQGLRIVAMPYDRPDFVMQMVKKKNLPYTVALDLKGEAVWAFGNVQLTPSSFLIAPDDRITKHKIGKMNMAIMKQQIADMLTEG